MDRTITSGELDIIDLGAASAETKGPPGGQAEVFLQIPNTGLSED